MDDNKKLKPFDRVLVRDNEDNIWGANIFSHYRGEGSTVEYICIGFTWRQCIPYEGNEHLLGTDKDPKCECEEPTFLQKVIANNPDIGIVKGYFIDKFTTEEGKILYRVLNAKEKIIEYFKNCVADEWEE